ncbi:MAG: hypothetical protein QM767_09895 [Anaeromyxobacter sp.]
MPTPGEIDRARDLERRRVQEERDLETEQDHSERPLEGLSGGPTTWTQDQDEAQAEVVHGDDEKRSVEASREQIPVVPPGGEG